MADEVFNLDCEATVKWGKHLVDAMHQACTVSPAELKSPNTNVGLIDSKFAKLETTFLNYRH